MQVRQEPTSAICPRKNAERRRIGHHHQIANPRHFVGFQATALDEWVDEDIVRRVEEERRHRDFRAARERGLERFHRQALSAQQSPLVRPGQTNDLDAFFFDTRQNILCGSLLSLGPQTMLFDEFFAHRQVSLIFCTLLYVG